LVLLLLLLRFLRAYRWNSGSMACCAVTLCLSRSFPNLPLAQLLLFLLLFLLLHTLNFYLVLLLLLTLHFYLLLLLLLLVSLHFCLLLLLLLLLLRIISSYRSCNNIGWHRSRLMCSLKRSTSSSSLIVKPTC
jgi:hypothetical protein